MKKSADFMMEEILEDLINDVRDDLIEDCMLGATCPLDAKPKEVSLLVVLAAEPSMRKARGGRIQTRQTTAGT